MWRDPLAVRDHADAAVLVESIAAPGSVHAALPAERTHRHATARPCQRCPCGPRPLSHSTATRARPGAMQNPCRRYEELPPCVLTGLLKTSGRNPAHPRRTLPNSRSGAFPRRRIGPFVRQPSRGHPDATSGHHWPARSRQPAPGHQPPAHASPPGGTITGNSVPLSYSELDQSTQRRVGV